MFLWKAMLEFKIVSFAVIIIPSYAAYYEENAEKWIPEINQNTNWEAGYNPYLRGMSEVEIKRLMGTIILKNRPDVAVNISVNTSHLPETFFAGEHKWTKCFSTINYIKDQATCGSCWAVAASEVIADRICIANYGSIREGRLNEVEPLIDISALHILSCCHFCGYGCDGGFADAAMKLWGWMGVVSGGWYGSECGCQPYSFPPLCLPDGRGCNMPTTPLCSTQCRPHYPHTLDKDRHYADAYYTLPNNAGILMEEMYRNGPIECSFTVYENFMHYKGGVYGGVGGGEVGGHAVKLVGWGEENGTPYWLINNSWNVTWGINGRFKFMRGKNLAGMEENCVAGRAKIRDPNLSLIC